MKYIDADRLRAEIEKRIENYNASIEKNYSKEKTIKGERDSWKWAECKWFLNLITSLQQEQPEGLDEAAVQAHIMMEESGEEMTFLNTFRAGAKWQKAQMMKDAVEGTVMDFLSNLPRPQVNVLLAPHKYHTGDKVRIIIVKED